MIDNPVSKIVCLKTNLASKIIHFWFQELPKIPTHCGELWIMSEWKKNTQLDIDWCTNATSNTVEKYKQVWV